MNVVVLTFALTGLGLIGWKLYEPYMQTSAPEPAPDIAAAPAAEPTSELDGHEAETTLDIPPQVSEPLILPGFGAGESVELAPPPPSDVEEDIPDLPDLNAGTVNDTLLARAKSIAREHPDVNWLREYVVAAHFLLAGREIQRRKYRDALRYLDGVEEWGPNEGDVASFRAVIYSAQEQWELAERWAEIAIAQGSRTNPAEMHHILGKVYYYREDLAKAIEEFKTALAISDTQEIRTSLQRAQQELRASAGYEHQRLSNFIVRYEGGSMEDTGRMVIDQMDRSHASLVSQLGFEPSEPIVVILYSRRSYTEMGGPHWSAGLFDGKIKVPVRGLERLDQNIKTTLHHELAHAFIHARAGKAAPRWLHEGIAEYVEGTRTHQFGKELAKIINSGQSFSACLPTARCNPRVFYPAAASIVDYMIQSRGMGTIRDVLTRLGEGSEIDGALNDVLGRDQQSLIRDWEHFIRRRYS